MYIHVSSIITNPDTYLFVKQNKLHCDKSATSDWDVCCWGRTTLLANTQTTSIKHFVSYAHTTLLERNVSDMVCCACASLR